MGAITGSFLNVVIYRLPLMRKEDWNHEMKLRSTETLLEEKQNINLIYPRSFCPHCFRTIRIRDNIPLLSYLCLNGRASCCGQQIPYHYLLVEVMSSFLFILAALLYSPGVLLIGAWIFFSILLALAFIDHQTYLLPDTLTLPLIWIGLLFNLRNGYVQLEQAVIGVILGYLILWLIYWGFRLITNRETLGYGDFKLLAALGAWMGWQALPHILLLAAVSGLFVVLLTRYLSHTKLNQPLAFGPWLVFSAICNILWFSLN